jgi:hypothetical protein
MIKTSDLFHLDLLSSAGATCWAMGAQFVPEMANLVSYPAAFAFAAVAFTRWVANIRKRQV